MIQDWEDFIRHCERIDEFSENKREEMREGIRKLKVELGDNFIMDASRDGHGFMFYIIGDNLRVCKWIIQFAKDVYELKSRYPEYYSIIRDKLIAKKDFPEGLSLLVIINKLSNAGFERIHYHPDTSIGKHPDLGIEDDKEKLFIEVSTYRNNELEENTYKMIEKIFEPLRQHTEFDFSCRINKIITGKDLKVLEEKIKNVVRNVKDKFEELVTEEIDIGIAPENNRDLERWANERSLKICDILPPLIDITTILRTFIGSKINDEVRQLPKEYPGIVVIEFPTFLYTNRDAMPYNVIENMIESYLRNHSKLLAIVIYGEYIGNGNDVRMKGMNMFTKKTIYEHLAHGSIIIFNRHCEFKIPIRTLSKIYDTFIDTIQRY